jgi:hypothetical protein
VLGIEEVWMLRTEEVHSTKVCALLCSSEAGWVQVVEGVWMKRTQLWMLGPVGCIW